MARVPAAALVPVAVLAAAAAAPAAAQNLPPDESIRFSRYTAVRERVVPGYETPGVPVGSFTLSPSAELSANATDNVFALEDDRRSDAFVTLRPSAQLTSNWTGRSLNLSADGTFSRFARNGTEDLNAVNVSAYATQDFGGEFRARVLGRFRTNRESRESQNAFVLTRRPVFFRSALGSVGLAKRLGSIQLSGEAGLEDLNFRDAQLRAGGELDQDYRDGTVRSVRGRADVIQSTAVAYFVQATHASSSYAQPSFTGVRRGARTTEVLAGARFELPVLARGEVGVGYITSSFRDERFQRFSGLAVNALVSFFPSQLTTVTVTARRSVNDAGTPDSSTYATLSGGVQVDHELLRSLILGASLQLQRDSFNGVDRDDRRVAVGVSADYRLNRRFTVRVGADRLDLSSDGAARYKSFVRHRALVGMGVRI